jgi:branched-subunit amino acid transport protein AzlD
MPDTTYLAATVAIAATITFALRAAPFAAINRLRSASTVTYLSQHLPSGIMIILVVYLLRGTQLTHPPFGAVQLVPVAVTAATYAWKRHMLLSMGAGTLSYALMLALTS